MKISREQEHKFCTTLLKAFDMREEEAETLSRVVVHSDFTGVYSHGLSRFSLYLRWLTDGVLNPRPNMHYVKDNGSTLIMDVDNGIGVVAVDRMYNDLLARVKEHGIVMGTALHASNIGCGSYYARRGAEDGVIAAVVANTTCLMAPIGGAEKLLGTNPIIIGFPAGDNYPIIIDMATSFVAMGKILAAARERKEIPLGWALDKDGVPTNSAAKVYSLVPFGQHKGYCLAVAVDMFSSLLSRAAYAYNIGVPPKKEPENTGFAVMLIDVDKFIPIAEFRATVDNYIKTMKESKLAEGSKGIMMPGEPEFLLEKKLNAEGVEVSDNLQKELMSFAAAKNLAQKDTAFADFVASL